MKKVNNSKGKSKNGGNWFKAQEEKKTTPLEKNSSKKPSAAAYKPVEEAPIIQVQMKSKREAAHFEAAYAFAQRMSDPKSEEVMTVHLNMQDELVFNILKDEHYERLWQVGELMLLVEFPRNWKTAELDIPEDEADDFDDIDSDADKFDYLYETGMAVYNKK